MTHTGGGYDPYAFIADLYDHVGPYRDRPDVPFFVDFATSAGGAVLEVGCGTGRVLIPCARAGVEIVGIDLSPHMLAVCRKHLRAEPAEVQAAAQVVEADMRDFDLGRTFPAAMIPFRAFQHLITVEDQLATLRRIREHLTDGGQLVVDVFNPSLDALANRKIGEEFGEEPAFTTPDGRRVVRRHKIVEHDRLHQVNHVELIYLVTHPDGREERLVHAFQMRYAFRHEMEHLLARCGFEVVRVLSDYDGREFGEKYPGEMILIASAA